MRFKAIFGAILIEVRRYETRILCICPKNVKDS